MKITSVSGGFHIFTWKPTFVVFFGCGYGITIYIFLNHSHFFINYILDKFSGTYFYFYNHFRPMNSYTSERITDSIHHGYDYFLEYYLFGTCYGTLCYFLQFYIFTLLWKKSLELPLPYWYGFCYTELFIPNQVFCQGMDYSSMCKKLNIILEENLWNDQIVT